MTICSTDRYDLAGELWYAGVKVGERTGLAIVDAMDEAQEWVDNNPEAVYGELEGGK